MQLIFSYNRIAEEEKEVKKAISSCVSVEVTWIFKWYTCCVRNPPSSSTDLVHYGCALQVFLPKYLSAVLSFK